MLLAVSTNRLGFILVSIYETLEIRVEKLFKIHFYENVFVPCAANQDSCCDSRVNGRCPHLTINRRKQGDCPNPRKTSQTKRSLPAAMAVCQSSFG